MARASEIKSVFIAGAGTMGRGITELLALAGIEVQLWDYHAGTLGRASAAIEKSLRKQMQIERISEDELDCTLGRIRLVSDFRVASPATDLVIEAVIEDFSVKQTVLSNIEAHLPEAFYATNTSSLSLEKLSSCLRRREKLVGIHFSNPAPVMPLVEIVYWMGTDETWVHRARSFVERQLGKQTIVVKDSPGFAASRLGTALALEAMRMVEQKVASIEDIDKAMEYGYRHPMGPLRYSDWVGLDVRLNVAQILYAELEQEMFRPPRILEQMVAEGRLGRKTGQGFYKWPKEG